MKTYNWGTVEFISPNWDKYEKYCHVVMHVFPNGKTYNLNPDGFCSLAGSGNWNELPFYWRVENPDVVEGYTESYDYAICESVVLQRVSRLHGVGAPNLEGAPNHLERLRNITANPPYKTESYTLSVEVWTDPIDPQDDGYGNMVYSGFNYQYEKTYSFNIQKIEGMLP